MSLIGDTLQENDRLKQENKELVEALEQLLSAPLYRGKSHPAEDSARALLARIKGD